MTASKLPRGTTEICDKGDMTTNTASPVQPGTDVTLSCQLKPLQPTNQCRVAIFFNSSELISNYSSAVSTKFLVRTYGKHVFTCKTVCEHRKTLICGIEIESGSKENLIIPCSSTFPVVPLRRGLETSGGWPFPEKGLSFSSSLYLKYLWLGLCLSVLPLTPTNLSRTQGTGKKNSKF